MSGEVIANKENLRSLLGLDDERSFRDILRVSTIVAFLIALIVHVMLVYLTSEGYIGISIIKHVENKQDMTVEYLLKLAPQYVEANPNVPENEPDDTQNESFRSQQAAQELPDPTATENAPEVKGEMDDANKIVQGSAEELIQASELPAGRYSTSEPSEESPPSETDNQPSQAMPSQQPMPLPDFIVQKPVSKEGPASTVEETGQAKKLVENARDKKTISINRSPNLKIVEEEVSTKTAELAVKEGQVVPLPRPKISFNVPQGILMKRPYKTSRLGTTAIDSKMSEFGEYTQRMVEAVSDQWNILNQRMTFASAEYNTMVAIVFRLDRYGEVHDLQVVQSTASQTAMLACQDAVLSRSPFGEWTADMLARLGEETIIRFSFYYR